MKHHTLFFLKIRKMLQNLWSAAVLIGALRVNPFPASHDFYPLLHLSASLYCKKYGPRVHSVCFHIKILSEVDLSVCSRH